MLVLVLGLIVFIGTHSARIFADPWRSAVIARSGAGRWKLLFTLLSLIGFVLIIWGYGQARTAPIPVWMPPVWARHLTGLLVLLAFVLVAAAYVPGNAIRARLHHPMILGVKTWAFAHLIANGSLAGIVLFGTFLVWAVLSFRAARRRDRAAGTVYPAGTVAGTAVAIVAGLIAWAAFAFWLHGALIGVRPFG